MKFAVKVVNGLTRRDRNMYVVAHLVDKFKIQPLANG